VGVGLLSQDISSPKSLKFQKPRIKKILFFNLRVGILGLEPKALFMLGQCTTRSSKLSRSSTVLCRVFGEAALFYQKSLIYSPSLSTK
jgi:hypothetical protein